MHCCCVPPMWGGGANVPLASVIQHGLAVFHQKYTKMGLLHAGLFALLSEVRSLDNSGSFSGGMSPLRCRLGLTRIVDGGHFSGSCTVLDLMAYGGHRASLLGILAAFAYSAFLVNSGPMPVPHGVVITCNNNVNNCNNDGGKGKVVELMKQNDTEAGVKNPVTQV